MDRGLKYKLRRKKMAQDYGGYASRDEYLQGLAEEYAIPYETVVMISDMLGPNEDRDGLISALEDYEAMSGTYDPDDESESEIWAAKKAEPVAKTAASKADAKASVDRLLDVLRDQANVQSAFDPVIEYFAEKDEKWEEFNIAHSAMMESWRKFEDKLYKVYGLIIS